MPNQLNFPPDRCSIISESKKHNSCFFNNLDKHMSVFKKRIIGIFSIISNVVIFNLCFVIFMPVTCQIQTNWKCFKTTNCFFLWKFYRNLWTKQLIKLNKAHFYHMTKCSMDEWNKICKNSHHKSSITTFFFNVPISIMIKLSLFIIVIESFYLPYMLPSPHPSPEVSK